MGVRVLALFARPVMRLLLFTIALLIAGYLSYVHAYMPLTEDAQLSAAVSVQQVQINDAALASILASSQERARSVQKSFSFAPAIFSHAATQ